MNNGPYAACCDRPVEVCDCHLPRVIWHRVAPPNEPRLRARRLSGKDVDWRRPGRWSDFGQRVRAAAIACGAVVVK